MMKPLTKSNQDSIINNLRKIKKTGNMELLNKEAYNFVILMPNFIAHYDRFGFIHEYHQDYQPISVFFTELANSFDIKQKERYIEDTFFSTGDNADYYRSKYEVLSRIQELFSEYTK